MTANLKLSHILNYIVLGGISFILLLLILEKNNEQPLEKLTKIQNSTRVIFPIITLGVCYLSGLIIQSMAKIICGKSYFGTSISDMCHIVCETSTVFRFYHIPNWLFWTKKPEKIILSLMQNDEITQQNETKNEWHILNNAFIGIHFLFTLFIIIYPFIFIKNEVHPYYILSVSLCLALFFQRTLYNKTILNIIIINTIYLLYIIYSLNNLNNLNIWASNLLIAVIIVIVCSILSGYFAISHIGSMPDMNENSPQKLNDMLIKNKIPTVYILTRTNTKQYLDETLNSVAVQTYPKIKVILLEDKNLDSATTRNNIKNIVSKYKDQINILHSKSNNTGTRELSIEIRKNFVDNSFDDDIAITLDSDDCFTHKNVVSDIVTKIYSTKANICILGFETFGLQKYNFAKNYHNFLIREIDKLNYSISVTDKNSCKIFNKYKSTYIISDLYHIETLGWTKCYKRPILEKYIELQTEDHLKPNKDINRYEDFPDNLMFLFPESKITAVGRPSYRFRKSEDTATSCPDVSNYSKQIPSFLSYTYNTYYKSDVSDKYFTKDSDLIKKLLVYKFIQYMDVVFRRKAEDKLKYDCNKFYQDLLETLNNTTVFTQEDINKEIDEISEKKIFSFYSNESKETVKHIALTHKKSSRQSHELGKISTNNDRSE